MGCIVTSREGRDNWNAIDPNFVIDDQDQPWLVWGSFWDGIQLARLDTTMHIAKGEKPRTIARRYNLADPEAKNALPVNPNPPKNPTSDFAGPNAIEAPFIFKHDGWYYLFVSWDWDVICAMAVETSSSRAIRRPSRQPATVPPTPLTVRTSSSVMVIASPIRVPRSLSSVPSPGRLTAGRH